MGLVTGVEITRTRAAVYVDGVLFLKIRKADFESLPLHEGDDVNEEEYADRLSARQMKAAYESALSALDRRDMTAAGMRALLMRRGYLRAVCEAVADRLIENKLIDDQKYAERYVERKKLSPTGIYALRRSLRAKGIDEETAEAAVEDLDDEQQQTQATILAQRLMRRYEGLPAREARAKLSQALARRGFSWDAVSAAVEACLADDEDYEY